jgi:hypothetical protein
LSFWVRSSLTGSFGAAIQNSSSLRSYPFSYTISVANTWEQKTVTVAGDTTGTWLKTNGIGLVVSFGLGVGSTYGSGTAGAWSGTISDVPTGSVSVVGTSGATFYITGVQLEKGSTATSFDYRPYGTELALCQRYFFKMLGTSSYEKPSANGYYTSSTVGVFIFAIPIQMRTSPTLTTSNLTTYPMNTLVGNMPITSFSVDQTSLNTPSYSFTVASGGTIGAWTGLQTQGSTATYLWFSSEL